MILEAGRLFHNSSMEEFFCSIHSPHRTVALNELFPSIWMRFLSVTYRTMVSSSDLIKLSQMRIYLSCYCRFCKSCQRRGVRVRMRIFFSYNTVPSFIIHIVRRVIIITTTFSRMIVTASICIILTITALFFRLRGSNIEYAPFDL